jgi:hypothetical protein
MAAFKANTWLSIPQDAKITALALAGQGESDYKSFSDDAKRGMLIAIIGAYLQVLEGQVSDGRGSADVSSKDVTSLFLWMLAAQFQEIVNKQLFPQLVALNYAGVGSFRLVLGGVSEQEVAAIIANAQGMQAIGYPLSKADVARRTSWGAPKNTDDELKPPQQAAPSPFGGAPAFSEVKEAKPVPVPVAALPQSPPMPVSEESPRSAVARRAKQRARGRFIPFVEPKPDTITPRIDWLSEQIADLAAKRVKTVEKKLLRDAGGRAAGTIETETVE